MSYNKMFPMIAAVAAIGCAAGAHAAASSNPGYASEAVSVRVKLDGLDLASPAGAAVGLLRIHNAAREICGFEPGVPDLQMRRIYDRCMTEAVNQAVDRLGNPIVSALNGRRQSAVMASNSH